MKDEELIVDGKPISEWADENGWIQIGSWQVDPKELSIKWINDSIAWEIKNAKREALQEARDIINRSKELEVIQSGEQVFLDGESILIILDALIKENTPVNTLPES